MDVERVKEQVAVTGQNGITQIVKIDDGFNGLARAFALMKLGVQTMSLVILKRPDVHNSVEGVMNDVKNSGFRDEMQLIGMSAVRRMKTAPMN